MKLMLKRRGKEKNGKGMTGIERRGQERSGKDWIGFREEQNLDEISKERYLMEPHEGLEEIRAHKDCTDMDEEDEGETKMKKKTKQEKTIEKTVKEIKDIERALGRTEVIGEWLNSHKRLSDKFFKAWRTGIYFGIGVFAISMATLIAGYTFASLILVNIALGMAIGSFGTGNTYSKYLVKDRSIRKALDKTK